MPCAPSPLRTRSGKKSPRTTTNRESLNNSNNSPRRQERKQSNSRDINANSNASNSGGRGRGVQQQRSSSSSSNSSRSRSSKSSDGSSISNIHNLIKKQRPSAVRVRPLLERTKHPLNNMGHQSLSNGAVTSSTPIGHILHISIPGLVERAEHWLKRVILQTQRANSAEDDSVAKAERSNIYNWSNDRDLSVIGYLLCWNLDEDLDLLCTTTLGIRRGGSISLNNGNGSNGINDNNNDNNDNNTDISFGTYGCDGAMTFVVPSLSMTKERFAVSPELNALHRLGVVTLFMSLMPVVEQLQLRAASGELATPEPSPSMAPSSPTSLTSSAPSAPSAPTTPTAPTAPTPPNHTSPALPLSPAQTVLARPQDLQHFFSKLITHYGIVFPDMYGDTSIVPSLGMLSYYAVGRWETASVGARLLLQAIIERMEENARLELSTRWSNKLHQMRARRQSIKRWRNERTFVDAEGGDNSGSSGSGGVSGRNNIVGSEILNSRHQQQQHQQPSQTRRELPFGGLSPQLSTNKQQFTPSTPDTAKTIFSSLSPLSSFNAQQEPYDNVEEAKYVVVLGMLGVTYPENLSPSAAKVIVGVFLHHIYQRTLTFSTVATELIGKGFPLWRPHIPDIPRLLRHLLQIIHSNRMSNHQRRSSDRGDSSATTTAAAAALASARHALMEAGITQPLVFMSAVGQEVLRQDMGLQYHKTCLNCIVQLVKNNPLLMVRHLSVVVEAVIRPLYPGEPILRKMCLIASTMALHELVKRFPMVAFHQETQRLACGTLAGRIILYDLRTATKWRILEASDCQGGVSVVTFDAAGEVLASYSAEDACICTWTAGSGGFLGGILGMQGRRKQKINLNSRGLNDSMMSDVLQHCRLQFSSRQSRAKQLKLRREDGQIVTVGLK